GPKPPTCGNNRVDLPDEECEPPGTATCDDKCLKVRSADCQTCQVESCDQTLAGCALLKGQDKTDCDAVMACIRSTHCDKNGDPEACYCGTVAYEPCVMGKGNGPCRMQIETAAHPTETDPEKRAVEIATHYGDPNFPIGRAVNLVGC